MRQNAAENRVSATRVDGSSTIKVGFFGSDGSRLFSCLHAPSRAPTAGVIVCSPLHADFVKNYGSEVLLARRLADRGVSVMRFHYRGQGHSDGEPNEVTLASMVEDTLLALAHLRSRTGVGRVGFVGCRLGGIVAAAAACALEGAPLLLWEPVLRPDTYVREAIRSKVISSLSRAPTEKFSSDMLMSYLNERGYVDIHGYPIYRNLVRSLQGRSLVDELGSEPRAVRVIQISRRQVVRSELKTAIDEWLRLGFEADVRCVTGDVAWWFRGAGRAREDPGAALAHELVTDTVSWMTAELADGDTR